MLWAKMKIWRSKGVHKLLGRKTVCAYKRLLDISAETSESCWKICRFSFSFIQGTCRINPPLIGTLISPKMWISRNIDKKVEHLQNILSILCIYILHRLRGNSVNTNCFDSAQQKYPEKMKTPCNIAVACLIVVELPVHFHEDRWIRSAVHPVHT